jgi:hypothetical protein
MWHPRTLLGRPEEVLPVPESHPNGATATMHLSSHSQGHLMSVRHNAVVAIDQHLGYMRMTDQRLSSAGSTVPGSTIGPAALRRAG